MKTDTNFVDLNNILLDNEDRERLYCYKYYPTNDKQYLRREESRTGKNGARITWLLHHDIIGKPPIGMMVDHINRNKLDNRKCNLRFVTRSQNNQNRKTKATNGFIGVHKTSSGSFSSACHLNKKMHYLIGSKNPVICAIAYDNFQLKNRDNPRINFPTILARKKALKEWRDKV
jgi:hypothetical protein